MKKTIMMLGTVTMLTSFFRCSTAETRYVQDKDNIYYIQTNRGPVSGKVNPLYKNLEWNEPISVYLLFSQNLSSSRKLKSIEVKLYQQKNDEGGFNREMVCAKRSIEVGYWNGSKMIEVVREDFQGDLFTLIDSEMEHYQYPDMVRVTFALECTYAGREKPDSLHQRILIKWTDGETVFENVLVKKTFTKSCISGRPYG